MAFGEAVDHEQAVVRPRYLEQRERRGPVIDEPVINFVRQDRDPARPRLLQQRSGRSGFDHPSGRIAGRSQIDQPRPRVACRQHWVEIEPPAARIPRQRHNFSAV